MIKPGTLCRSKCDRYAYSERKRVTGIFTNKDVKLICGDIFLALETEILETKINVNNDGPATLILKILYKDKIYYAWYNSREFEVF